MKGVASLAERSGEFAAKSSHARTWVLQMAVMPGRLSSAQSLHAGLAARCLEISKLTADALNAATTSSLSAVARVGLM